MFDCHAARGRRVDKIDHAQMKPSLKSIGSRSMLPWHNRDEGRKYMSKDQPVRDNEGQRTQNHECRDDHHITRGHRQPRHIVGGAITATPTTHPILVMAMLSFCKQRDKAVRVSSCVHSGSENVAVRIARAKHTRGGRQRWDISIGQS